MKKVTKIVIISVIALIALIVVLDGFFILGQAESALVLRFGRIESVYVKDEEQAKMIKQEIASYPELKDTPIHYGTGLKMKIPFIDSTVKYTSKLMTYDTRSDQIIARDKKALIFDNNAQWQIRNPVLFFVSVKTIPAAKNNINNYLYARMRDKVGKMDSTTVIADKNEVETMLLELDQEVSDQTKKFGVTVFDIRIKRTDLPQDIYNSIYQRMITERNRIATQYRSEGEQSAIEIRSKTDREVMEITSEARKKAETIKGEGDQEAARVFNITYGKNPSFFEFYNLLETYRTTIGNSSTMVIPLNSPFAKYLLSGGGLQ